MVNFSLRARSEEAKVGGGGVVSHLQTTFQLLINIYFPKIVEGGGGGGEAGKTFSAHTIF